MSKNRLGSINKGFFSHYRYIEISIFVQLICTIVWIYPLSFLLKIALLIYGLCCAVLCMKGRLVIRGRDTGLLLITLISSVIGAIVFLNKQGINGLLFPAFDIISFFLIYRCIRNGCGTENRALLEGISSWFVPITFIISFISILLFIRGQTLYFRPQDFIFTRLLGQTGLIPESYYNVGYYYGYSQGYLYGCSASANFFGFESFYSVVLSFFTLKEIQSNYKKFFISVNIALQLIVIILIGMRSYFLGIALFVGVVIIKKIRINLKGENGKLVFVFMTCFCAGAMLLGVVIVNRRSNNLAGLEARDYEHEAETVLQEKLNSEGRFFVPVNDHETKIALEAYDYRNSHEWIKKVDAVSTMRFRIWVTTLFSLKDRFFIGKPSNTVKAVNSGTVSDIDFHSAYVRALSIYGIIGALCLYIVFMKIIQNSIRIIRYETDKSGIVFISVGVISQMVINLTGGGLSASIDLQVLMFWLMAGMVSAYMSEANMINTRVMLTN